MNYTKSGKCDIDDSSNCAPERGKINKHNLHNTKRAKKSEMTAEPDSLIYKSHPSYSEDVCILVKDVEIGDKIDEEGNKYIKEKTDGAQHNPSEHTNDLETRNSMKVLEQFVNVVTSQLNSIQRGKSVELSSRLGQVLITRQATPPAKSDAVDLGHVEIEVKGESSRKITIPLGDKTKNTLELSNANDKSIDLNGEIKLDLSQISTITVGDDNKVVIRRKNDKTALKSEMPVADREEGDRENPDETTCKIGSSRRGTRDVISISAPNVEWDSFFRSAKARELRVLVHPLHIVAGSSNVSNDDDVCERSNSPVQDMSDECCPKWKRRRPKKQNTSPLPDETIPKSTSRQLLPTATGKVTDVERGLNKQHPQEGKPNVSNDNDVCQMLSSSMQVVPIECCPKRKRGRPRKQSATSLPCTTISDSPKFNQGSLHQTKAQTDTLNDGCDNDSSENGTCPTSESSNCDEDAPNNSIISQKRKRGRPRKDDAERHLNTLTLSSIPAKTNLPDKNDESPRSSHCGESQRSQEIVNPNSSLPVDRKSLDPVLRKRQLKIIKFLQNAILNAKEKPSPDSTTNPICMSVTNNQTSVDGMTLNSSCDLNHMTKDCATMSQVNQSYQKSNLTSTKCHETQPTTPAPHEYAGYGKTDQIKLTKLVSSQVPPRLIKSNFSELNMTMSSSQQQSDIVHEESEKAFPIRQNQPVRPPPDKKGSIKDREKLPNLNKPGEILSSPCFADSSQSNVNCQPSKSIVDKSPMKKKRHRAKKTKHENHTQKKLSDSWKSVDSSTSTSNDYCLDTFELLSVKKTPMNGTYQHDESPETGFTETSGTLCRRQASRKISVTSSNSLMRRTRKTKPFRKHASKGNNTSTLERSLPEDSLPSITLGADDTCFKNYFTDKQYRPTSAVHLQNEKPNATPPKQSQLIVEYEPSTKKMKYINRDSYTDSLVESTPSENSDNDEMVILRNSPAASNTDGVAYDRTTVLHNRDDNEEVLQSPVRSSESHPTQSSETMNDSIHDTEGNDPRDYQIMSADQANTTLIIDELFDSETSWTEMMNLKTFEEVHNLISTNKPSLTEAPTNLITNIDGSSLSVTTNSVGSEAVIPDLMCSNSSKEPYTSNISQNPHSRKESIPLSNFSHETEDPYIIGSFVPAAEQRDNEDTFTSCRNPTKEVALHNISGNVGRCSLQKVHQSVAVVSSDQMNGVETDLSVTSPYSVSSDSSDLNVAISPDHYEELHVSPSNIEGSLDDTDEIWIVSDDSCDETNSNSLKFSGDDIVDADRIVVLPSPPKLNENLKLHAPLEYPMMDERQSTKEDDGNLIEDKLQFAASCAYHKSRIISKHLNLPTKIVSSSNEPTVDSVDDLIAVEVPTNEESTDPDSCDDDDDYDSQQYDGRYVAEDAVQSLASTKCITYLCTRCAFTTSSDIQLRSHMDIVHQGDHPFTCTVCPYKCNSEMILMRHMKFSHDVSFRRKKSGVEGQYRFENSNFVCNECSQSFKNEGALKVHVAQIHEPVYCAGCLTYIEKGDYEEHLDNHGYAIPCSLCSHMSPFESAALLHLIVAHKITPGKTQNIFCPLCPASRPYTWANLKRHTEKSHFSLVLSEKHKHHEL